MKEELRGAMYMRMFGNEFSYSMLGANNGIEEAKTESTMYKILQKLRNNEMQTFSIAKNVMFIDSTVTVPTLIGLPLKLTVNGTASVALDVGGQVDMRDPLSAIVIEGTYEPRCVGDVFSIHNFNA